MTGDCVGMSMGVPIEKAPPGVIQRVFGQSAAGVEAAILRQLGKIGKLPGPLTKDVFSKAGSTGDVPIEGVDQLLRASQ